MSGRFTGDKSSASTLRPNGAVDPESIPPLRHLSGVADEKTTCRRCGDEIPEGRLRALPDTQVCVRCSEAIGGEDELEVTISATGKAGSLKKTGQTVSVTRKKKRLK